MFQILLSRFYGAEPTRKTVDVKVKVLFKRSAIEEVMMSREKKTGIGLKIFIEIPDLIINGLFYFGSNFSHAPLGFCAPKVIWYISTGIRLVGQPK